MESSLRRAEKTYIGIALGLLGTLVLLFAIGWGGSRLYGRWQEHQYMHQAHAALEKGNVQWASLAARRAFFWRSESLDACRTLAEICDRQMNSEAIDWRRRALEIQPDSVPDLVNLAETALRFESRRLAADALARVPAAKRSDPAYQSAAARLALASNDLEGARQHLTEAARLSPDDPSRQLALAEFELRSDDRAQRESGRALADQLRDNPQGRIGALEILLDHALRWHEDATGVALAREINTIPKAPFALRLRALTALRVFNDSAFAGALGHMQTEAHDSSEKAVILVNWMNDHSLALLAIDWSKQLPDKVLNTFSMQAALADSYIVMRDWTALATILKKGSWAGGESLRLALQSKLARETGDNAEQEKNWAAAVESAGSDRSQLEILQRLASQWHWTDKATAILWLLANNPEKQHEALQALYRYYSDARDTTGLYRTLVRLVELMPDDSVLQNNLALVSTLLNVEVTKAFLAAKQLYEKEPKNAAFASTYAFALYRRGDVEGAAKVMERLTPEQLKDPLIALYYGVILARSKRKQDAAPFLDLGGKAILLPEEENLLARARSEVARQ